MTTNALYIGLALLLIMGCSNRSNPMQEQAVSKDEAEDFALYLVEIILKKDASTFERFLADTVFFLEPWEQPRLSVSISVEPTLSSQEGPYTLEDYFNVYEYQIMEFSEYTALGFFEELTYWKPDEQDFFFWGSKVRDGKRPLILDDLLIFMISKRSGSWKIRSL